MASADDLTTVLAAGSADEPLQRMLARGYAWGVGDGN